MIKQHKIIKYSILILGTFTVSACSSFGYYMDLMSGHSELLEQQKPISEILANKETESKLRQLLETSQNMRDFASKELHLPENDSYRTYADIKRPYAVWNVVAAKEFSIKPKKWCFLFIGCLSYRGYFSKEDASMYANELKKEGYDVYVAGAKAYSTLGWFDDPLLNTMMYKSEARRAGIIFHELAHQVVYIDDDSAFNEAFATTVEQEGIRRWMAKKGKSKQYEQYRVNKKRDARLNALLRETREKLKQLYKTKISEKEKRQGKKLIFSLMQKKYQRLKKAWGDYAVYDKWMSQELNNAHLLLIATYHDLVPAFKVMLKKENNNLKKFYIAVEQLGQLDKEKRKNQLKQLVKN
jgi:predicted aminopeptidase